MDVVRVQVNSGLSGLNCAGLSEGDATSGFITLRDGSATVRCTQDVDATTDFEQSVEISLDYAISQDVAKTLLITHTG